MDALRLVIGSLVEAVEVYWGGLALGAVPGLLMTLDISFKRRHGFDWSTPGADISALGVGIYYSALFAGHAHFPQERSYPVAFFIGFVLLGLWYLIVYCASRQHQTSSTRAKRAWGLVQRLGGLCICWLGIILTVYYYNLSL